MKEDKRKATIISIGTELTEGIIQDTHLRYLSQQLKTYGIMVERAVYLPDNFALIRREAERTLLESDILIFTGGLGPTSDDLTREVISDITGKKLVFVDVIWNSIIDRFKGRKIADVNKKQAMIPEGFEWLRNSLGTAPGLYGKYRGRLIVALPGPPKELRGVFEHEVLPRVVEYFGLNSESSNEGENALRCSVFMTPESELEETLIACREIVCNGKDIEWGTRVSEYYIEFNIRGGSKEKREGVFRCLRERLGIIKVRKGVMDPALVLSNLLREKKLRLVTVESCTGGLVGKLITDIPGSSEVYWGGMVVYSNESKENLAGVDKKILDKYGAVSKEAVEALAWSALDKSKADLSIAISGVAGPEGGTPDKPVGTVFIGVALRNGERKGDFWVKRFKFLGNRERVRRKSTVTAMLLAENLVLGNEWLDRYSSW